MTQLLKHNPPHQYGDCGRACIAHILGMPQLDVPHFFVDGDGARGNARMDAWLWTMRLRRIWICLAGEMDFSNILVHIGDNNPNEQYLVVVGTTKGTDHIVVCRGSDVEYDPANYESPYHNFHKTHQDGVYWVEFLVGCWDAASIWARLNPDDWYPMPTHVRDTR